MEIQYFEANRYQHRADGTYSRRIAFFDRQFNLNISDVLWGDDTMDRRLAVLASADCCLLVYSIYSRP
jgi:hypothetical protein